MFNLLIINTIKIKFVNNPKSGLTSAISVVSK